MIRLHTLGALDLRDSTGKEIRAVLAQPKRLALLTYIALQGGQGFVARDQVLALFWPDQDDEHARGALNRALHYLRRALGDGVLLSRGSEIGLSRETFWCDAVELEAAVRQGRHRRALELYRGDLLEGFHVSDTAEFSRWLDAKRDRLRECACQAAWSLAEAEQQRGDNRSAAGWARRAVELSPHSDAYVQRLMSLLDASGDRAGAVLEYERFAERLSSDLELSPGPETLALLDAIRARDAAHGRGPANLVAQEGVTDVRVPVAADPETTSEERGAANDAEASPRRPGRRARRRRLPRIATFAFMSVAVAGAGALFFTTRLVEPDANLVEIAAFANRSGDRGLDSLAGAATDWIERSVTIAVESPPTVPEPIPIGRVVRRGSAPADGEPNARVTRAGTVVSGELYLEHGYLYLHVRVTDVARGRRRWASPPMLVIPELAEDGLEEAGQRAAGAVVALRTPRLAEWFPVATAPPTFDALVAYLQGFGEARVWDSGQHFERAAELDTMFTWGLLEASSMGRMLDRARAHEIVTALNEKRDRLNPLQIAVLNAHVAREAGDRRAYYQALGVAAGLAPARFLTEYAMSAWALNMPRRTLELLDQADAQRPNLVPASSWQLRTTMLHELREHSRELALTRQMRSAAPRVMAPLRAQVRALSALGEIDEVMALVDSALSLPVGPGSNPGSLMILAAEELRAHGHRAPGAQVARRAIEWYRNPAAFTKVNPWPEDDLAYALYLGEEWDEAQALYHKLLEAHASWRVEYFGRLGAIAARRGDRARAEEYLTALAVVDIPAEGEAYEVGFARARIAAQLGDAERALAFLREGYRGGQGVDLHTDVDFQSLLEHDPGFKEFARPKG